MRAFIVALERMAAEERGKAASWHAAARFWSTDRPAAAPEGWAAEHEARAQIYEDWAKALGFPGGPVHVDYVRYGTSRESVAS